MVATSYNPGLSSCTTFGINARKSHRLPGETQAAQTIINKDVVLVIDDEINLTNQVHLRVRYYLEAYALHVVDFLSSTIFMY
jgi:hypothetical protein